jgi:hypothetical protein
MIHKMDELLFPTLSALVEIFTLTLQDIAVASSSTIATASHHTLPRKFPALILYEFLNILKSCDRLINLVNLRLLSDSQSAPPVSIRLSKLLITYIQIIVLNLQKYPNTQISSLSSAFAAGIDNAKSMTMSSVQQYLEPYLPLLWKDCLENLTFQIVTYQSRTYLKPVSHSGQHTVSSRSQQSESRGSAAPRAAAGATDGGMPALSRHFLVPITPLSSSSSTSATRNILYDTVHSSFVHVLQQAGVLGLLRHGVSEVREGVLLGLQAYILQFAEYSRNSPVRGNFII